MSNQVITEFKVQDEIKYLTELQEVDDELRDLALERGDLPQEVERLLEKIQEVEKFIAERSLELEEVKHSLTKQHHVLTEAKAKLEKYQQQLYAVKNNREYEAVTNEINTAKSEIAACEKSIADLSKREQNLRQLIGDKITELEEVRVEEQEKSVELRQHLAETEDEELQLRHRREKVLVRIKKPLYAHYERIRLAKDGRGVARMASGACGGCFALIPPQTQAEVRKMNDITLCETCGRIIVP
jgi:predicted  nucleic acid-binding Zn-ribbon protein